MAAGDTGSAFSFATDLATTEFPTNAFDDPPFVEGESAFTRTRELAPASTPAGEGSTMPAAAWLLGIGAALAFVLAWVTRRGLRHR